MLKFLYESIGNNCLAFERVLRLSIPVHGVQASLLHVMKVKLTIACDVNVACVQQEKQKVG